MKKFQPDCSCHLPPELLLRIWRRLTTGDVNRIRLVCRYWNTTVEKNAQSLPARSIDSLQIECIANDADSVKLIRTQIQALSRCSAIARFPIERLPFLLFRSRLSATDSDGGTKLTLTWSGGKIGDRILGHLYESDLTPQKLLLYGTLTSSVNFTKVMDKWRPFLRHLYMYCIEVGPDDHFIDDQLLSVNLNTVCVKLESGQHYFTLNGLQNLLNVNRCSRCTLKFDVYRSFQVKDVVELFRHWKTVAEKTLPGQINQKWNQSDYHFTFGNVDCLEEDWNELEILIAVEVGSCVYVIREGITATVIRGSLGKLSISVKMQYNWDGDDD